MPTADPLHRRRAALLLVVGATLAFALSLLVAVQRPVPSHELRITRWFNAAPDLPATLLWPIMQLGTLAGPIIAAAAIVIWKRDGLLAGLTVATGLAAWYGAKGVKAVVERGRPLAFLPGIHVREGTGSGLGFVSGHATVAAATAVFATVVLPSRWKWAPASLAAVVGVARIVYGMHLPADVIGGWALGVLLALGALAVRAVITRRLADG